MNISYKWLKDLIDIELSANETADALTRVGLTVEGVHPVGDDFVLDIDLTSNRPDCLSHLGVARELSVISGKPLTELKTTDDAELNPEVPYPAILAWDVVKIDAPELCNRFTARIIKGVKIGPSPEWLVQRLEAIGERSINNVADITNYVMHELGQPMHAFDLDKLVENRIVVRHAHDGETITTLDEVERKLDTAMLAICDAEKPVAVAGIMGGSDSSITDETTDVLIEVAYFDRDNIRSTSRKLNLSTEASYRFERGVDINNLKKASDRAVKLICELAGGKTEDLIDVYPVKHAPVEVVSEDVSAATLRLTGVDVPKNETDRILKALGIYGASKSNTFIAPSWRHDISIEEDLVEEVIRHTGYEKIADELPPAFSAGEYQPGENRKKKLRNDLAAAGFNEAISYSFIDIDNDGKFELAPSLASGEPVTLRDSIIDGSVRMRQTLLPGLLAAAKTNFNQQRKDIRLFEIGKAFTKNETEDELPIERELLAILISGREINADRAMPGRDLDFYDIKGSFESALAAVGADTAVFESADIEHLRSGQAASVKLAGQIVGSIGTINQEIESYYKFKQPIYVAEIDLQAVLSAPSSPVVYTPLPKFPAVVRDVSFLVKRSLTFSSIVAAIKSQNAELCRSVNFVDIYEGKGIADDERSLTIRIEYRSDNQTLTETEVGNLHETIIEKVESLLGASQRY